MPPHQCHSHGRRCEHLRILLILPIGHNTSPALQFFRIHRKGITQGYKGRTRIKQSQFNRQLTNYSSLVQFRVSKPTSTICTTFLQNARLQLEYKFQARITLGATRLNIQINPVYKISFAFILRLMSGISYPRHIRKSARTISVVIDLNRMCILKDNHFLLHYFKIRMCTFKIGSFQNHDDIQNSIK